MKVNFTRFYSFKEFKKDINAILKKYGINAKIKRQYGLYDHELLRHHERLESDCYGLKKDQCGFGVDVFVKVFVEDKEKEIYDYFLYTETVGRYSNKDCYINLNNFDFDYFESELKYFLGIED